MGRRTQPGSVDLSDLTSRRGAKFVNVGIKLRRRMEELGDETFKALAERAEVSPTTVSRVMHGQYVSGPTYRTLDNVLRALNLKLEARER